MSVSDQTLVYDYQNPATAESFNGRLHKVVKPGVINGLSVSLDGENITITSGLVYIQDSVQQLSMQIAFNSNFTLIKNTNFTSTNNYIVVRFTYVATAANIATVQGVSSANLNSTDIILCKVDFSAGTVVGLDQTERSYSKLARDDDRKFNLHCTASDTPDAKVNVSSGNAYINGKYVEVTAGDVTLPSVTNGMISLITVDNTGTIGKIDSADAGSPTTPDYPSNKLVLATVTRGTTTVVRGNEIENLIIDKTLGSGYSRNSTIVIASSDSEDESQFGADYVINTSTNAATTINSIITALNTAGGGEIKFLEGTFNLQGSIELRSNISFIGSGYNTLFFRNSNYTTNSIDLFTNAAQYCSLENFRIDGNKSTHAGSSYNVRGTSSTDYTSFYKSIWSINTTQSGFLNCHNITTCQALSNNLGGFDACFNVSSCYANGNLVGFSSCDYISACKAESNTGNGFNGCERVSACDSLSNGADGYGFSNCISASSAFSNSSDGFSSCNAINCCQSNSNTAYGFTGCNQLGHNRTSGNGSGAYNLAYADAAGTQAAADTAAGGYNA